MLRRINPVLSAGQRRDRAGGKAGAMRRRIDAACQPRRDHETGEPKIMRQPFGEFQSGRRGVARTHDRDHRPRQRGDAAAHRDERRRAVDLRQAKRIGGFAGGDELRAELLRGFDLARRVGARADADRTRRSAAPRQIGQGAQRRPRAAVALEQRGEGARPDILAADQPQPVEPLLVGQSDVGPLVHVGLMPLTRQPSRRRVVTTTGCAGRGGNKSAQRPDTRIPFRFK